VRRLARPYPPDARWAELLDDVGPTALRGAFIDAGVAPQVAGGLVFFIDDQARGERHVNSSTAARYRRTLRGLSPARLRRRASVAA
jgi:hypothetical protein